MRGNNGGGARPSFDLAAEQFVLFLQNHDQIGNSARGTA